MISIHARHRLFRGIAALTVMGLVIAAGVHLSRPMVLVGRDTHLEARVACREISHQLWDGLLHHFVDTEGNVDYAAWKNSATDLQSLDEYLALLSRLDERQPANKSERLAFWVNAYNAVTVRGILREYPTTSIQNHVGHIGGYNIWRDLRLIVGDSMYSLGEIENSILRPFGEPRIHFAIVCASRGCPRLLNEAYTADRLEEQLERNTLAFFADATKCSVDLAHHELRLSPILKWYAADFAPSTQALLQRIAEWLPVDARSLARSDRVQVVYFEYDWSLNEQEIATMPLPPPE